MISTLAPLLYSITAFIFILTIIVFTHEFGHYIVAKKSGIKIEAFSIGFGPEIFGWNDKSGTRWKISALPFGGYVKMFGDINPASVPDKDKLATLNEDEKKIAFHTKPLWIKSLVVAAGPLANFIFAFLLLWGFFWFNGKPYTLPIISAVVANSAAESAGLQAGDKITLVDHTSIESFSDIQRIVALNTGTTLTLTIERDGKTLTLPITPIFSAQKDMFGNEVKLPLLGIQSTDVSFKELTFFPAAYTAGAEAYHIAVGTLRALGQIIHGKRDLSEITGPIGMAKYSGQAAKHGWRTVLWLMVIISINLGLVNLFPIPILDGGHLLYYAIHAVQGKPLADRYQEWGLRIGMLLVAMLFIFAIVNDVKKFF